MKTPLLYNTSIFNPDMILKFPTHTKQSHNSHYNIISYNINPNLTKNSVTTLHL